LFFARRYTLASWLKAKPRDVVAEILNGEDNQNWRQILTVRRVAHQPEKASSISLPEGISSEGS